MSRGFKVFLIGLLLVVIMFSFSYVYIQQKVDNLKTQRYLKTAIAMKKDAQTVIHNKSNEILVVALTLSRDKSLEENLVKKEYNKIHLRDLSSLLERYTPLHDIWFQVIDSNGVSLYRSWTDKHGDNIADVRKDIAKIVEVPKIISTLSVGKFALSFKSIVPIFDSYGRFIGMVEAIASAKTLIPMLETHGDDSVVLIDKRYKKQLSEAKKPLMVEGYNIAGESSNNLILQIIRRKGVEHFLNLEMYDLDEEDEYLFTLVKVNDTIDKHPMAYIILAKPLANIDMRDIYQTRDNLIRTLTIFFFFLLVFIYIIYTVNYKKFVEEQNELLEESVEEKTEELQKQNKKMIYLAHHDRLTGLSNKNLFLDRLDQAIKQAKRARNSLAVLFLDLDRFKEINDSYGHDVGDKLLQEVAKRLESVIRDEDSIARISGDEYTILLQNTNQINVIKVIDKICDEMRQTFRIAGFEINISFSIGISIFRQDGDTAEILLRNADTAMYKAKETGRNNFKFYNEEMTALVSRRLELDKEIRRGLKNGEFEAYFQPKVDAKRMKIYGLEALIRWRHPTKGYVSPGEFIPFAEEIGLIVDIDSFMLETCVRQLVIWQNNGYKTGKISINISTKKLESDDFRGELFRLIEKYKVDTRFLELEILESQIMSNPEKSIDIMSSIRSLGISLSIDDFGTGYSSLSYLKKLPVSTLKIDRSFIIDVPRNEDDVAIVRMIIALAKSLGLNTVAEGAESESQVEFLVQEGCPIIQGYYYSKPLSIVDCEAFLKKYE